MVGWHHQQVAAVAKTALMMEKITARPAAKD